MQRERTSNLYKLVIISAIVVGIGFPLISLILTQFVFNPKDVDIEEGNKQQIEARHDQVTSNHERRSTEISPREKDEGSVSVTTSIFSPPSHFDDLHLNPDPSTGDTVEVQTEDVALEVVPLNEADYLDADGNVIDMENWKLARMHKNRWFKPEDIPISREPAPDGGSPDGVYIWIKHKPAGPLAFQDPPEELKAMRKILNEELDWATDMQEVKKMFQIQRELSELFSPYKGPSSVMYMQLYNVPDSWKGYFRAVYEEETSIQNVTPP